MIVGKVFGPTTLVLRGFSWVASMGAACQLAWTCWRWNRSPAAALIGGLLALALPFTVRYAVEGKGYALLVLLICLAIHQRMRVLNREPAAALPCTVFWSAAALTHYYGMGLLLSQALLDGWRRRSSWRPLAWALVLPTLWMLWNLRYLLGTGGRGWIRPAGPRLLRNLLGLGLGERWPLVLLLVGLLVVALRSARPAGERQGSGWFSAWGLDAGVLLLVGTVLVSIVKPSAADRYYIVLVPACLGVFSCWLGDQLASGQGRKWRRWLVCGVLAAMLGLFWRDAYLRIDPPGEWSGSREGADYRTLAVRAAPVDAKFAPYSQCYWLRAYDRILRAEHLIRPQAEWQCLPEPARTKGSRRRRFEPDHQILVLAATQQPRPPLEELRPVLDQLRAGGYRCEGDPGSTVRAQVMQCRRAAGRLQPGPPSGAPAGAREPGR